MYTTHKMKLSNTVVTTELRKSMTELILVMMGTTTPSRSMMMSGIASPIDLNLQLLRIWNQRPITQQAQRASNT